MLLPVCPFMEELPLNEKGAACGHALEPSFPLDLAGYQGTTFRRPFFFLLVDSFWLSVLPFWLAF